MDGGKGLFDIIKNGNTFTATYTQFLMNDDGSFLFGS
jgi:hypothetical protein